MNEVARLLDMAPIRVYEVATFYSMFNLQPVGKWFFQVCTTTPCWLRGSDDVVKTCESKMGIRMGESTADGLFKGSSVKWSKPQLQRPAGTVKQAGIPDQGDAIDIAIANAAANPYYGALAQIPDEAFDKVFLNNVKSVLWLASMTLPGMAARGGGSFITVGSIGGIIANTVIGAYGMSKAADHHLVRNLAAEWGPKNVRVNAICPGLTETGMTKPTFDYAREAGKMDRVGRLNPLRRGAQPEELAKVALFLASDEARYITAQTLNVDGGNVMS